MSAIDFLSSFNKRKGLWILAANLLSKLLGFASVLLVTRQCTESEFGAYSYGFNIVTALIPFMGFGAYQAFIRFTAETKGQSDKKILYHYSFQKGILLSGLLSILLILLAPFICASLPDSVASFRVLSFVVITTLCMEYVKSYARVLHKNAISARIDIYYSILLLLLSVLLTPYFGVIGYAIAVTSAPLFASVYYARKLKLISLERKKIKVSAQKFWRYGIFTAIGAFLSQMFYAVDIYMIGEFSVNNSVAVALYRVAAIIPLATLILPSSVAATDFVKNTKIDRDIKALKHYIIHYWKTFGLMSIFSLALLWWLAPILLEVFGKNYTEGSDIMRILLIGMIGAHLFRVPFGNLLSAVGKAEWNTYLNAVVLVMTIFLCGVLLPLFELRGAAIAVSIMLWFSGLLNALAFWRYLGSLQPNEK